MKREYELVPYDCEDGECLMIHEKTTDSKLGALSLDHRSIGEAIVDELNMLSEKLYEEQCRTGPIVLTTHISDEDWERFKELFRVYCDNGDVE
ncbi:hypothetical protein [uncultured Methanobrevibacter sp.]|uniref:hypothetical protein n=1 Tax=uncultured Methanobrevibacter sp. TaxID=253161 RepID=UPI0025F36AAD|nr:hypothetical protein [uncultured Methanobrevibacter sp.]